MKYLDIIIPCYNEQECVRSIYEEIETVMAAINEWSFNVCYVDDGSCDNTLHEVEKLAAIHQNGQVRLISFSKGLFAWVGFKTKWLEQPILYVPLEQPSGLFYKCLKTVR